jgi:hypothetical protein
VFGSNATYAVGDDPAWVTAADVNGDGKVDLICANWNDNTLSVLTNNGSGGFVLAVTCAVGENPRSVTAADVNGDGMVDLICANQHATPVGSYGTLSVLFNLPTLAINSSSNSVNVSWPSCWTNWTLEQNSDLTTTNWSASGGINDISNTLNTLIITNPPPGNFFFRLTFP